jgi:6-phosphogluconolactonase
MKPHRIPITASVWLLAAFFGVAGLAGCHTSGNNVGRGPPCLVAACGPQVVTIEGTLTGLVGSGLQVENENGGNEVGGIPINGQASNGASVAFTVGNWNTAYNLTVQTQPTNPSQTCVVANGTGTTGGAGSTVTDIVVTCTTNPPRFVYVANRGSNNVSGYTIDAGNGSLAPIIGSPFAAGNLPVALAVDPTGTYAYLVNQTDSTISAFTIDRTSGALTPVSGSPFATGTSPTSVAIDSSSSYVYVTNGGANTVSAYAITAGSGALTALPGSPIATGTLPDSVAVGPFGIGLVGVLVANESDGTVSVFSIDNNTSHNGALTASGPPFPAGNSPRALTIDPSGQFIYLADATSNTLSGFNGSTADGAPASNGSAITGSPYATGSNPSSVAVDPLDNFVYVANQGSNNISAFALNAATGALTSIAGSPFVAGNQPSSVAVDPTGMFAYVVNAGADSVSVYAIEVTNGALTPIAGSPFLTGTQPSAIAICD